MGNASGFLPPPLEGRPCRSCKSVRKLHPEAVLVRGEDHGRATPDQTRTKLGGRSAVLGLVLHAAFKTRRLALLWLAWIEPWSRRFRSFATFRVVPPASPTLLQSVRIDKKQRCPVDVRVCIQSCAQSNRIALYVPPDRGVVIAEVVVVFESRSYFGGTSSPRRYVTPELLTSTVFRSFVSVNVIGLAARSSEGIFARDMIIEQLASSQPYTYTSSDVTPEPVLCTTAANFLSLSYSTMSTISAANRNSCLPSQALRPGIPPSMKTGTGRSNSAAGAIPASASPTTNMSARIKPHSQSYSQRRAYLDMIFHAVGPHLRPAYWTTHRHCLGGKNGSPWAYPTTKANP